MVRWLIVILFILVRLFKFFNKVYTFNSNYERVNYNIGVCYMIKNDYKNALNYLNKAVIKDSTDTDILINRAITNLMLKNTTKGCDDLYKAKVLGSEEVLDLITEYCN